MVLWLAKRPQHSQLATQEKVETISPEQVLKNDLAKIEVHIEPKVVKSELWQDVLRYELTPSSVVTKDNAATVFALTHSAIGGIHSCLIKDFCGMETRGDFDPYFDDKNTPSHILLERNLKLLKESLDREAQLVNEVDWDLINTISEDPSERVATAAMDLLAAFYPASEKEQSLLKVASRHTGEAKAKSLLALSKNASMGTQRLMANEIEESFNNSDANTVISVLEKLKDMQLSKSLLVDVMPSLCRFKESHNWPMIKYEALNNNFNLQNICE